MNDRCWPISASGEFILRVRYVPEAEVNLEIMKVC